jgi:hypothetical protein
MHDLIQVLGIICSIGLPALVIIVIVKLSHEQKMEMIRRGIVQGVSAPIYPGNRSLRAGIILICLGAAAIISALLQASDTFMRFGILFLGGGIGLIVYWKITTPEREHLKNLYEERFNAELASMQKKAPREGVQE